MNKLSRLSLAVLAVSILAGCAVAPQMPVALSNEAITQPGSRIGVAMTAVSKPDTHLPGADCLLCLAAASIANSSLTKYTQTLPLEGLPKLKEAAADLLRKRNSQVVLLPVDLKLDDLPAFNGAGPNQPKKDFRGLKQQYQIDRLVVLSVDTLGFERTYAAYIPTSDPKAVVRGTGYVVNLDTNTYEWYLPVSQLKSADGKWDEAPAFPGLTNAYFQAVELASDQYLAPLAK